MINLRGRIVPTIDLRLKFGLPDKEYTERTCIIVIEAPLEERIICTGLIVDEVAEVVNIPQEHIKPSAEVIDGGQAEVIDGFGLVDGKVNLLLDISKILTSDVLQAIKQGTAHAADAGDATQN